MMNQSGKSSLKIYLLITSIVLVAVVLSINFAVLPELMEIMNELSPGFADATRAQLNYATIGLFAFLFLENLFFWSKFNLLDEEEEKAWKILETNPNDSVPQDGLRRFGEKRKLYIAVIVAIFWVVLGAIVAFFSYTLLTPLYRLLGAY